MATRKAQLPGELDWFEPMVRELEAPAYQLAMMLTQQPDLAQEVVQDAFVRAWMAKKTPRELGEFRPWLYRIIVNLIHDYRRQEGHRRFQQDEWQRYDPVAESEKRSSNSLLTEALNSLTQREREIIYLRFFEEVPHRRIGQIIGANEIHVRVLLHRALKKIRKTLLENPENPQENHG